MLATASANRRCVEVMTIPQFSDADRLSEISHALGETGCVVVTDLLSADDRSAVRDELAPYMTRVKVAVDDPAAFYPGLTRRSTALVARSETVGRMVLHDRTIELCDHFLKPNSEFGYQLHVTAALEVGPGARAQRLHREHDAFTFFPQPRPNLIVASMWAITDFRPDNGATLLVPGSHKWPGDRHATPSEIVAAEMPAGSVLYWLGGTLHGAGANTSRDWRYGVILTYSCGWLRQEENQYLDVPPEIARHLSPKLRDIIGYKMHQGLGFSLNRDVGVRPD
jgi:ectoine hydroxylase-related dioxygenase (phytanoyl-CoA dioxygenase family)